MPDEDTPFNNPSPDPTVQDPEDAPAPAPPPAPEAPQPPADAPAPDEPPAASDQPLSADERAELEQLRRERQTAPAGPVTGLSTQVGTPGGATTPGAPPIYSTVPSGQAPTNRPQLNDDGRYVVQPGDSLPLIAEKFGQPGGWRHLHFANYMEIADPQQIAPGQTLAVPQEWTE